MCDLWLMLHLEQPKVRSSWWVVRNGSVPSGELRWNFFIMKLRHRQADPLGMKKKNGFRFIWIELEFELLQSIAIVWDWRSRSTSVSLLSSLLRAHVRAQIDGWWLMAKSLVAYPVPLSVSVASRVPKAVLCRVYLPAAASSHQINVPQIFRPVEALRLDSC